MSAIQILHHLKKFIELTESEEQPGMHHNDLLCDVLLVQTASSLLHCHASAELAKQTENKP